jgi:hypothetical protein
LLIFASAELLGVWAREGGEGSDTRAVLALEQAWSGAESRGDNRTLDRIFDNALVYIKDGALVTKGECLSRVRLAGSHPRQIEAGTTAVHMFGSTAIVVGTYREIGVKDGKTFLSGDVLSIPGWTGKEPGCSSRLGPHPSAGKWKGSPPPALHAWASAPTGPRAGGRYIRKESIL